MVECPVQQWQPHTLYSRYLPFYIPVDFISFSVYNSAGWKIFMILFFFFFGGGGGGGGWGGAVNLFNSKLHITHIQNLFNNKLTILSPCILPTLGHVSVVVFLCVCFYILHLWTIMLFFFSCKVLKSQFLFFFFFFFFCLFVFLSFFFFS